jgi:hypothetical protein
MGPFALIFFFIKASSRVKATIGIIITYLSAICKPIFVLMFIMFKSGTGSLAQDRQSFRWPKLAVVCKCLRQCITFECFEYQLITALFIRFFNLTIGY